MTGSPDITAEHVAATQLRLVLDEKLGRTTPEWVRQVASAAPDHAPAVRSIVMDAGGGGVRFPSLLRMPEGFLRAIVELEDAGVAPTRARVAVRVGSSGPTTSGVVDQLVRDGLVAETETGLQVTEGGRAALGSPLAGPDIEIVALAGTDSSDLFGLMIELGDEAPERWRTSRVGTRLRIADLPDPDLEVLVQLVTSWLARTRHAALQLRRGDQVVEIRAGQNLDVAALLSALVRS